MKLAEQAVKAKQASAQVRILSSEQKNRVLMEFAGRLEADAAEILQANAEDMRVAKNAFSLPISRCMVRKFRIVPMLNRTKMPVLRPIWSRRKTERYRPMASRCGYSPE